jgi:hypothetical protein
LQGVETGPGERLALEHGFAGVSAGCATDARGGCVGSAGTAVTLLDPEEKPKSANSRNSRAITT